MKLIWQSAPPVMGRLWVRLPPSALVGSSKAKMIPTNGQMQEQRQPKPVATTRGEQAASVLNAPRGSTGADSHPSPLKAEHISASPFASSQAEGVGRKWG